MEENIEENIENMSRKTWTHTVVENMYNKRKHGHTQSKGTAKKFVLECTLL